MLPVPHSDAVARTGPVYGVLVWKSPGGTIDCYAIPSNDEAPHTLGWWKLFEQAHGKYIGRDEENEGMCFLYCATREPDGDSPPEWAGVLLPYRLPEDHVIQRELITRLYFSGFA